MSFGEAPVVERSQHAHESGAADARRSADAPTEAEIEAGKKVMAEALRLVEEDKKKAAEHIAQWKKDNGQQFTDAELGVIRDVNG